MALEELDIAIGALQGGDVHQTRTALKRTRALLDVAVGGGHDPVAATEKRALRDAGRLLSEARDVEVCLETLEKLEADPHIARKVPAALFAKARKAVAIPNQSARVDAPGALARLETTRRTLAEWQPVVSWKDAHAGLRRTYRRSRRALRCARSAHIAAAGALHCLRTAEAMHALRKRLKMLWAQLRLVRECHPKVIKEQIAEVEGIAHLLGNEHDLVILRVRLFKSAAAEEVAPLIRVLDTSRALLDRDTLELAHRFLAENPADFMRRVVR